MPLIFSGAPVESMPCSKRMSCDNSQSHGCPSKCCATSTSNDSDAGSVRYVAGGNGMRGREVGQRSEGLGAGHVGPSVRGVLAECMQGEKKR